jgi:hypothetical protein
VKPYPIWEMSNVLSITLQILFV